MCDDAIIRYPSAVRHPSQSSTPGFINPYAVHSPSQAMMRRCDHYAITIIFFRGPPEFRKPCARYQDDDDSSHDSSDSADEDPARPHRQGRVNVANPRTPGGRLVPSRSLEIERPVIRLDMTGVTRRA